MIKYAYEEGEDYPLTKAVIQGIVDPSKVPEPEWMNLNDLLGDAKASKLSQELCIGNRQDIDKAVKDHHEPDVVIKAFIQLAES